MELNGTRFVKHFQLIKSVKDTLRPSYSIAIDVEWNIKGRLIEISGESSMRNINVILLLKKWGYRNKV